MSIRAWVCAATLVAPVLGADVLFVRQAWRVARKRNQLGCGGIAGDLEVKVLYTPGKGKC